MIKGNLVNLRALSKSDSKQILKWVNNPKLKYLTGTVYPVSEIEHEGWFESKLSDKINKVFGIEESTTKSFIGIIGLAKTDFINRNTEIYIYIGDEKHWGKGFGSDAVNTLVQFIFKELNLHRVSLVVFSYNKRAISTYEKVGFSYEGVLRESLYRDGKYHDKIIMSIIKDEDSTHL